VHGFMVFLGYVGFYVFLFKCKSWGLTSEALRQ